MPWSRRSISVLFLATCLTSCSDDDVRPGASAPEACDAGPLGELYDRLGESRAGDSDSDRLPDDVEETLGTDPKHPDTDRDGIFEYEEIFGDGELRRCDPIPDRDDDGEVGPLDDDDDGDGAHDGELIDNDGDGIANYKEYYGYVYDWASGQYRAWDGADYSARYFKSDPNQASTDQDPYDDGMEASGENMDVSVTAPGSYPMIPAFADVVVTLQGYAVTLNQEITWSEGESLAQASTWERTVESTHQITDEINWGVTAGVEIGADLSASFSASFGGKHETTRGTSTAVATGSSITTEENWSRAISSNPTSAANLKLFLKVTNHGTAVASNVVPTLTVRIGGHNVATFEPSDAQINVLEPGAVYPQAPGVYWVVDSIAPDTPLTLTLNELRALESGAPVSITTTQMAADVMQRENGSGPYVSVGDWNQYLARIDPVSADLYLDMGDGDFVHSLVYAGSTPTAPRVTLGDALVWGAGARFEVDRDLTIAYRETESGRQRRTSLRDWHFAVDADTFELNGFDSSKPLPKGTDVWNLRLSPDSIIVAKPPRERLPDAEDSFAVHYAFFDASLGTVNVVTTDYRGIATVEFIDKDDSPSLMREVVPGSSFYSYNPNAEPLKYPSGYVFDNSERIVVTNLDGDTRELDLAQLFLPLETVPVAPLIQNVRLDLLSGFVSAEIQPDPAFLIDWVSTFYRKDAFGLVTELEMQPVTAWFEDVSGWSAEVGCDFVVGDSKVVAYVQPQVYAEREIRASDATYVKTAGSGQIVLSAHHDWTATDYYAIMGIDFDTGRTYYRAEEEGDWQTSWDPPAEFETWLRWENVVDWKLFWNADAKRITPHIDPECAATAEPLDCIDIATLNRCDLTKDASTFGVGDYFLVKTEKGNFTVVRIDSVQNSSSSAGNWRHRDIGLSYRVFSNVEREVLQVLRASYNTVSQILTVHATSNKRPAGSASLSVSIEGTTVAALDYEPFIGIYKAELTLATAPTNLMVKSGQSLASAGVTLTSEVLSIDDLASVYDPSEETAVIELASDHDAPDGLVLTAYLERDGSIAASKRMTHEGNGKFLATFPRVYEKPDAVVVDSSGGGAVRYAFP